MAAQRAIDVRVNSGRVTTQVRRGFYFYMSVVLLLAMLIGFAPTVYLRGMFFEVAPIPLYLHVHGAVLSGWFFLLVLQTWLAKSNRIKLHRSLGVVGAVYAALALTAALIATLGFVPRTLADGYTLDQDVFAFNEGGSGITIGRFISGVVWSNLGAAISFTVLVSLAILLRRRPEAHKRLMLVASIGMMGPALARISRWPILGGEQGPFTMIAMLALMGAVVSNDVMTTRRIHPATAFGVALRMSTLLGAQIVAESDLGQALIRYLA
jgi:hypothetical protein